MPAVLRNALRERLYHVDADHRRLRIADREADTTNAAVVERLQLGIGHRRMQNADAARIGYAELPDGVDGDAVVRHVVAWLHDDDARDAYALLQQPVILHRAVRRMRALRLEARVVNMDMAVGRVRRRLELRRVGAGRIRHPVLYVVVHCVIRSLSITRHTGAGGCPDVLNILGSRPGLRPAGAGSHARERRN